MHNVLVPLIWTFLPYVRGNNNVTLTTALTWNNEVSVKPTTATLQRRIAVDIRAGERSTISFDIFHKVESVNRRRRNHGDVWNWDFWCQLQAQRGNCTKNRQRYYYNALLDQCGTFTYSGCFGNKNNFETAIDCERHCKGAALMPTKYVERSISCSLQPNVGLCVALFDKFYYDVNERTCKVFVYGGCGGNQNRFSSQQQCVLKCANNRANIEEK